MAENDDGSADGAEVDNELNQLKAAATTLTGLMDTLAGLYQKLASLAGQAQSQPHLNPGQVTELKAITVSLNTAIAEAQSAIAPTGTGS